MFRGGCGVERRSGAPRPLGATKMILPGLAMVALLLVVPGCGESSKGASKSASLEVSISGVQTPSTEPLTCVKRGGTLTVLSVSDFEHIDPGAAYYQIDYEPIYATQRPLYSYKPNTFGEPSPDLAETAPEISPDTKTVTVHLRHGVHFSPPVNREVTSTDVKYALERGANPNVVNSYFQSYFRSIEGAPAAKGGPIAGIRTPDRYTIVFHLTEPRGQLVADALVLPLSAPVPEEYAKKLDAKTPSAYGANQVATGPYMFASDSHHTVVGTGYKPATSATLVRNPNWSASTDFRPACVDKIVFKIGGDPNIAGRQALEGSHTIENDGVTPTSAKLAYEHFRSQLGITPGAGNHYVSLNNAHGPFTKVNLRRAVYAAMNRVAILRAGGGKLVASVGTHFLYPGVPGFEQAGGYAGPRVDFNEHLEGDKAVAEKYMKAAGYPSGKYTGSAVIQIVTANAGVSPQIGEIVDQTLKGLGFKTRLSLVAPAVVYSKYCGVPKEEIDACVQVGWIADFGDGYAGLYVPFSGKAITTSGSNFNFGQVNIPKINQAMEAAEPLVGTSARAAAWGKIDAELVEEAAAVPLSFGRGIVVESKDVAGVQDVWNGGAWDLNFSSLR